MNYSRNKLLKEASIQDSENPLQRFREEFYIENNHVIYLDGNSLGRLSKATLAHTPKVMKEQWGQQLIRSWNKDWYTLSERLSEKIASIVGARNDEIIICDSTSINLFKLGFAALKYQKGKNRILTDNLNFPSDIYILQGLTEIFNNQHHLEVLESSDGLKIPTDKLHSAITEDTALVSLSHVVFKSAYRYPMEKITTLAHNKGALILWDLSHSVGAVPIHLNKTNVDMAIGCTYKYLNGGPGAPAFLYVRKDLQEHLMSPIQGWFGHASPFSFDLHYKPQQGIQRFLAGTPQILSLSALEPALDLILQVGIENIRNNSIQLTEYLIKLIKKHLTQYGFTLQTPEDFNQRGSHISIAHPEAFRITQALTDENTGEHIIIPDFREPDIIRLGISPLYTTFKELALTVFEIIDILYNNWHKKFTSKRHGVT